MRAPRKLRLHLELAAEARRRGDHGAANLHECDALLALHSAVSAAREVPAR